METASQSRLHFWGSGSAILLAIFLLGPTPPAWAQGNNITVSPAEFQRLVYSTHLQTQLEARPELDACLQVLLELQRRNLHAEPAALAGAVSNALQRYRLAAPAYIRTNGCRDEILAAYLDSFQQVPARTNFVPAHLTLLRILIARAKAPTSAPLADVIHSGSGILLSGENDWSGRKALLQECTKRAQANPAFARAMDCLLLPEISFSVSALPAQIITNAASPLHNNLTMQTLLGLSATTPDGSLTVSSNQLMTLFTNEMLTLRRTVETNLALRAEINQTRVDLLAYLRNRPAIEANVQRELVVKHDKAPQIACATAAILVHSQLMEGTDSVMPGELEAVGSAMSSIAKGVHTITEVGAGGFAKCMAGGDLLEGGLKLFDLFMGAESPEDKIVREIGNIKTLIGDLSTNMNYRFDRVDQTLTNIFYTMNAQFEQIRIEEREQGRQIAYLVGSVDNIRFSLLDIQSEVYRLERNLATFSALNWRADLLQEMDSGLGYEAEAGHPMAYDSFLPNYVSMQSDFHYYACTRSTLETLSRCDTLPFSEADLYYQLTAEGATNVYAETLNYLKKNLRLRLGVSGFPSAPVLANPQDWNAGVGAWLQLAVENPGYFHRLPGAVGNLNDMILAGNYLTDFFTRLTLVGTNVNWPVYTALLDYYSGKLNTFCSRMETNAQGYAGNNGFVLETLRQWDPPAPRFTATATAAVESGQAPPAVPLERIPAAGPARPGIIAMGGDLFVTHGLALDAQGRVAAWGDDHWGEGAIPPNLEDAAAVSAGEYHSLALRSNRTVLAWGETAYGKLGIPSMATNVVAISAADDRNFAIRADGRVVAWGYNRYGHATGVPSTDYYGSATGLVSVAGQTLTNAVAADGGVYFSLALKSDGTVAMWGECTNGETNMPPGLNSVAAISAGGFHSLALRSNGTVVAWGVNNTGQTNVPAGLTNAVAVAAGEHFSLALRNDGTVVGWGWNEYGQTNVPAGLSNVVAIAAARLTSAALQRDGRIVVWGLNDWLRDGPVPVPPGLTNIVALAGGWGNCLGLRADGSVAAWGDNYYYHTNIPPGLTGVAAIAASDFHCLALRTNGTVTAWGKCNFYSYGATNVPVGLNNVIAIAAGADHSLALKADGRIVPWGKPLANTPANLSNVVAIAAGGYHCLALTTDGQVHTWGNPAAAVPASAYNVVAVATSGNHDLALRDDGKVIAWGDNTYGQCDVPDALRDVVAIAAAGSHSVALCRDGTIRTWGYNYDGQRNVPVAATNVVAIAAGGNYTLYLTDASADNAPLAPALSFLRAPLPAFVYLRLRSVNQHLLTQLDLDLHNPAIELCGAKALLTAVLELGLPYTLERDDVLHGFLYGSEPLFDLAAARSLLNGEIARLNGTPSVPPTVPEEVGPQRLACFTDRLQSRLDELAGGGQPEIPRLVGHTLRLLTLLRDAWATVPPPSLEMWQETNSPRLVLYGEPYAHYTLQSRDGLTLPGWATTTITNLHSEQPITPPVSGPRRFYRAALPTP